MGVLTEKGGGWLYDVNGDNFVPFGYMYGSFGCDVVWCTYFGV